MNPLLQNLKKTFSPLFKPFSDTVNGIQPPTLMSSNFRTPKPVNPPNMSVPPATNMSVAPTAPYDSNKNMSIAPAPVTSITGGGKIGPLAIPNPAPVRQAVTSTGQSINPATGGISNVPPVVPPAPFESRVIETPPAPVISPYQRNVTEAEKAYSTAGAITPEEDQTQAQLDELISSTRLGIAGKEGQGRGIPLSIVRGEQEKLERQGLLLTEPLEKKLARLQAKRTSALATSKFALERADKALETEKESKKPISGTSFYDPTTGTFKVAPKDITADKDSNPARVLTVEEAKNLGVPFGTTAGEAYGKKVDDIKNDKATKYSIEKANRAITLVDEALGKVNRWTTGFGALLGVIPESDAKDFGALVESIKANIGFNELSAMRAASPTGGALGQVAVQELNFLQSVLGSLDTKQSPAVVKSNLEKIKTHFNNWKATLAGSGENTGGSVVQTSVGPINTNW